MPPSGVVLKQPDANIETSSIESSANGLAARMFNDPDRIPSAATFETRLTLT